MKYSFLLSFLLLSSFLSFAQYNINQNKVWVFGNNAGLDFTSGYPTPITTSLISDEGCASVSDSTGHLLFYTDGRTIWDRTNTGFGSMFFYSVTSTSQGALIIPVIDSPNQYYVFGIQQVEDYQWYGDLLAPRQYVCKIDMTLNGGLGGVIPGSSKLFAVKVSEKQIAIPGNNNDIWLLTHKRDSAAFFAYHIAASGIDSTPVVSNVGNFVAAGSYNAGVMKCSHDRKKIIVQNNQAYVDATFTTSLPSQRGTELYDFDPLTGHVSNCNSIETGVAGYGAEFSPDNSKLYTMSFGASGSTVCQYDISLTTTAAILASKTIIATGIGNTDLKAGPDGKIYFSNVDSGGRYLDRIDAPNSPGTSCNYIHHVMPLLAGTSAAKGFPNLIVFPKLYTSGVDEKQKKERLNLYPNPVRAELTVYLDNYIGKTLYIINSIGQVVITQTLNSDRTTINVQSLQPGVYFIGQKNVMEKFEKL